MTTTRAQEAKRRRVRKRLLDDFDYYARNSLKIRTKQGEIVKLQLNEAQQRLLDLINDQRATTGKVRVIILKARQMGLSTAVGAWMYWWTSQHRAQKAIVVTHHSDSTKALFDMTKRYYDNTPEALKPSTKYSSRKELQFDKLDSGYMVATAGSDSVGRSETLQLAHISELAFWPKSTAKDNLNGLLQAIPNVDDTAIFIESTANGISGEFYEMWQGAVEGRNEYIPIFLPWFIQDEYREPVPSGFKRTPDEEELATRHGLDDEQLMFRRLKIAASGADLFKQEYPSTPEEAFLTTGRPVFNAEKLMARLPECPDILYRMGLVQTGADFTDYQWEPDPRGELLVYREHDPGETYYIGADVADGTRSAGANKSDWSVAQVLDSRKRQVATWRGQVDPDYYAIILYHLGTYYNEARLAPERNNHGILPCTRLAKDYAYGNLHTEVVYDKTSDKETINIGFQTNVKTKPLIIDQLRADVRNDDIELNDKVTIKEMTTFIVTDEGKMEAEANCHDDTVMALAIANHIHEGRFDPIDSTDDFYVEAI